MANITVAELKQVFPKADEARINEMVLAFNQAFQVFGLDTNLRRAHFFAQALEEVGPAASIKEENLNYAADKLAGIFGYFKKNPADAQKFGRTSTQKADQMAIANRAYANRMGNGDIASGDGWKYRGKGFIQLTGKSNYVAIQQHITAKMPQAGIDILQRDGDILTVRGAMLSAMAFFSKNNGPATADQGATDAVVNKVTNIVNSATPSKPERVANFHKMRTIFHV